MNKYLGIRKVKQRVGKPHFRVAFNHNGVRHEFGRYLDEKECAKAYDLYVIKKGIDRPTNFLKKKLV